MKEIKDCVACGSTARVVLGGRVKCMNRRCQMTGPKTDRYGEKWNKLPRKTQGRSGRRTPPWQKGTKKVEASRADESGGDQ